MPRGLMCAASAYISTNLLYNPVVPYYDYTTAKAGLLGLTRLMATELALQMKWVSRKRHSYWGLPG